MPFQRNLLPHNTNPYLSDVSLDPAQPSFDKRLLLQCALFPPLSFLKMELVCLQESELFQDGFQEKPVFHAVQPCVGQK